MIPTKLGIYLPVSQELLEDSAAMRAAFPTPYLTSSGVVIWTLEPLDPLIHSLRWNYESAADR